MAHIDDISPISVPWRQKTRKTYNSACSGCEVWTRVISLEDFSTLLGSLDYDRSKGKHSKGRIVIRKWGGLRKKLRLEPSAKILDIGEDLDRLMEDWPVDGIELTFWYVREERAGLTIGTPYSQRERTDAKHDEL